MPEHVGAAGAAAVAEDRARPRRPAADRPTRRRPSYDSEVEPEGGVMDAMTHIRREFIEEFADNTNRHELGIGLLGRCLGLRRRDKIDEDVQQQLDAIGANTYRQVVTGVCTYAVYWPGLDKT